MSALLNIVSTTNLKLEQFENVVKIPTQNDRVSIVLDLD